MTTTQPVLQILGQKLVFPRIHCRHTEHCTWALTVGLNLVCVLVKYLFLLVPLPAARADHLNGSVCITLTRSWCTFCSAGLPLIRAGNGAGGSVGTSLKPFRCREQERNTQSLCHPLTPPPCCLSLSDPSQSHVLFPGCISWCTA